MDECEASSLEIGSRGDFGYPENSLYCRANHALMAVKEGEFTSSDHCLHAQLQGQQRCGGGPYVLAYNQLLSHGKRKFYGNQCVNTVPGVIGPIYYLIALRGRLFTYYPSTSLYDETRKASCGSADEEKYRSSDGTCNNLEMPLMGAVDTPFDRSTAASDDHPDGNADETLVASILQRPLDGQDDPSRQAWFNQIAVAWVQFMTHDWFAHDKTESLSNTNTTTLSNKVTHWWDGSQIYGSSDEEKESVRASGGKLLLDENDEIDYTDEGLPITGFTDNFWSGLHVMHTIFAREHNYIVDELSSLYPSMTDDELFETARLCISAVIAKIHTVEWTPTLLDNTISTFGLNINWFGLEGAARKLFTDAQVERFQFLIDTYNLPHFGDTVAMSNSSFFMTEEFVSVYRMHPLLPDKLTVEESDTTYSLNDLSFTDTRTLESEDTTSRFLKALGKTPAQALSLDNYPSSLYGLETMNDGVINLAEIDLIRDRERGLPRYNDARRQLGLEPLESIDDLTTNEDYREKLKSVYTDIEQVDLMVGSMVDEERPEGFAFGVVPYHVFVVMASRRVFSDRFFQDSFVPEVYTDFGIEYVNSEGLHSILSRHFPEFVDIMPSENPFLNWD